VISETASSLATVRWLALEGNLAGRWMRAVDHALSALAGMIQQSGNVTVNMLTAMRVISLGVAVAGCFRVVQGHLTLGELFALQMLADRVTGPVLSIGSYLRPYQEVDVAIKELGAFMRGPVEETPSPVAYRRLLNSQVRTADLTMTYPGRETPALNGVSLSLPERGVIAIVGRNGSGKTSLLNVLLGLQRCYQGDVEIGHRDLRAYHPRSLRRSIGTVGQDTVLFAGSVRDNVTSFRNYSDDAITDALHFSGALAFVEELPDGIDTVVADNGRNLSGGQRQRLAIARAYIRDPRIVFLDEPTAFLDAEAAVALEQRLTDWGRDRLLILISHHLAATRHADLLLVMEDGRLVGRGSHDDLLASTRSYATLWTSYMRSIEGAA
jgi:ABC-type bacteriocin/lantibiotic exporter with double-glycine peptidase domain